ncbi:rRNA maturation RNase YbeY [Trueperella pecoris]|uniref:rRNA maturation RNase YbeY n=1 Tax=Trueperella pecoris TaxID=2733571 RepID=UPI001ABE092D|nr:rRNA maturation RNase YbeY [Trueperella pecoris]QTG74727.1 rRNA maturation RNase YbeY [Trueperella pecoris]
MIEVNDESGFEPAIGVSEVSELAAYVLTEIRVHPQADLSILFVDEEAMSTLHVEWMDLPGPTDVLSFPMDEIRPAPVGTEPKPGMLGDIVVCPTVAAAQALKSGHATMEEVLLLVTHGILHLLGYDHAEPEEKKEMFDLQRRLLLTFLARKPHDYGSGDIDDIAPTIDD